MEPSLWYHLKLNIWITAAGKIVKHKAKHPQTNSPCKKYPINTILSTTKIFHSNVYTLQNFYCHFYFVVPNSTSSFSTCAHRSCKSSSPVMRVILSTKIFQWKFSHWLLYARGEDLHKLWTISKCNFHMITIVTQKKKIYANTMNTCQIVYNNIPPWI